MKRVGILLCAVLAAGCGGQVFVEGGGDATASSGGTGGGAPCADIFLDGDHSGAVGLVLDGTHAYWVSLEGRLERGSLDSGESEVLTTLSSSSMALGVDDSHVYVADTFQLMRIPKSGGAFESLAPGNFNAFDLAIDGDDVWLLDHGSGIVAGTLYRWSPTDGLVMVVDMLEGARALAVDATHVYVIAEAALMDGELVSGALLRVTKVGGDRELLASGFSEPFGVAVDAERVYWGANIDTNLESIPTLWSQPKSGGTPTPVATFEYWALAFALDDGFAYATLHDLDNRRFPTNGTLVRASLADGNREAFLHGRNSTFAEPAVNTRYVAVTAMGPPDDPNPFVGDVIVQCKR